MVDVKGFDVSKFKEITKLLDSYEAIGFQATNLGRAKKIIEKMQKDKATIFLSFTSNIISCGLREIVAYLVKNKMVDVLITSTGAIEEDLMKTKSPFILGSFDEDDVLLHRDGINRIGNVLVPSKCYEQLEDMLIPFFGKMLERQKKNKRLISPRELIFELGKTVNNKDSILYWATKKNIPIFCPGITDGALGLQLYFFKQKRPEFGIDVSADMKELADITLNAEKTGALILGGGIAKHHTIGVNILREGLDYAVYVTTATEFDGSLSGARPKEAKSWSKIKEDANNVCVYADASIVFPLLAACFRKK
ncbi:deoxyhypusine synthase [Candidatus Woesearchaeota archaeon]|nr:deoxyhypusine synthase [Candidatus Woesearchaeota archaeon]